MAHTQDITPSGSFQIPVLMAWKLKAQKAHVLGSLYLTVVIPETASLRAVRLQANPDLKEELLVRSFRHSPVAILQSKRKPDRASSNVGMVNGSSLFVLTANDTTFPVLKASSIIAASLIVAISRAMKKLLLLVATQLSLMTLVACLARKSLRLLLLVYTL